MKTVIRTCLLFCSLAIVSSAWAEGVSRGQFTSNVVEREPVDLIDKLSSDMREIKYFTELSGMQGQSVTHQWVYNDSVKFEKTFQVGGPRWRVWTSKSLLPGQTGTWAVHTLDGNGDRILTQTFEYQ